MCEKKLIVNLESHFTVQLYLTTTKRLHLKIMLTVFAS